MEKPLLSVIMPCYNVSKTFDRAIQSVLMQRVDFPYEIIIVDDASTDNSAALFRKYANKYSHIFLFKNAVNSGNAESFYQGLNHARGDYFCVLDADDYYTVKDKLQRQINFFRTDINQEYVAVAHKFLYAQDGKFYLPCFSSSQKEFNYIDFISQFRVDYYHTSTYMYRNIFRGRVPVFFREKSLRGDTPRTFFHLLYSNKKVKVLDFVGSIYAYTCKGIWSGLNDRQQAAHSLSMWTRLFDFAESDFEKKVIQQTIDSWSKRLNYWSPSQREIPFFTIDEYIQGIQKVAQKYAFHSKGFVFKGVYYSEFYDTLLASLGVSYRSDHSEYVQSIRSDRVLVVCGKLVPNGGGVFREIEEIVHMYPKGRVHILCTDCSHVPEEAIRRLEAVGCENTICLPENCNSIMRFLSEKMLELSPSKAYFYVSHDNPYAIALMNAGVCKNICLFSFDHGYICGIDNPEIDCIIAKRENDYFMLRKRFGEKVVYIPTWGNHRPQDSQHTYIPFHNHTQLITACAAARYYKVDGGGSESYLPMVIDLLKITGGIHYHYGMIPEEKLAQISCLLEQNGIQPHQFVNIPWVDCLADSMLEHKVDVFLEPFPTISYKITLEAMSVGIPVIVHNGYTRINSVDFVPKSCLSWNTKEDFLLTLSSLSADTLLEQSEQIMQYYSVNHDVEVIKPFFLNEKSFCLSAPSECTDDCLGQISDYRFLFQEFEELASANERSLDALNLEQTGVRSASLFQRIKRCWKSEGFIGVILHVFQKVSSFIKVWIEHP